MAGRKTNAVKAEEAKQAQKAFDAAVNAKVAEMLPEIVSAVSPQLTTDILAQLEAARAAAPGGGTPSTPEGDKGFASALALAIANLSSQGTGKADYVPPAVLEERAKHHKRMIDLVVEAKAAGNTPKYRVLKPVYFNETKIMEQWFDPADRKMKDTFIWWDQLPSNALEPANDIATEIFAAFSQSLGDVPDKRNDPVTPWVRTDKRLFRGMSPEQREQSTGGMDLRVAGQGAPRDASHKHILGNVAPPSAVT